MFGTKDAALLERVRRLWMRGRTAGRPARCEAADPIREMRMAALVGTETYFATSRTLWWAR